MGCAFGFDEEAMTTKGRDGKLGRRRGRGREGKK